MSKVFVVLQNGIYGVYDKGTNIFTEDNRIIDVKTPEETYEVIEWRRVPLITRKLLNEILELKHQRITRLDEQKTIQCTIDDMEKSINELRTKIRTLEEERIGFQREIDKLVKCYSEDKKIREIQNSIKGNELEDMSFYKGTLDKIKAKAIILKSTRPITYTYGFAYRNPTTYHVPKTIEEALEIISNEYYLDITFGKNEIHLNAFSSNDMW